MIVLSVLIFVDGLRCAALIVILSETLIQYSRFAALSAVHHDKTMASVDNMLNHFPSAALSVQDSRHERAPLLEVIKAACRSSQANQYHWVPFKLVHQVHQSQEEHLCAYMDAFGARVNVGSFAKAREEGNGGGALLQSTYSCAFQHIFPCRLVPCLWSYQCVTGVTIIDVTFVFLSRVPVLSCPLTPTINHVALVLNPRC
jgi:hypothetical protein